MRVGGQVAKVLPTGLWVKFLGYFAGSVDIFHLDQIVTYEDLATSYKKGQKVRAVAPGGDVWHSTNITNNEGWGQSYVCGFG